MRVQMSDARVYSFCDGSDKLIFLKGEISVNTEIEVEGHSVWGGNTVAQREERYRWREEPGFDLSDVVEANGHVGEPVVDSGVGWIKHTRVRELIIEAEQNIDDRVEFDDSAADQLHYGSMNHSQRSHHNALAVGVLASNSNHVI